MHDTPRQTGLGSRLKELYKHAIRRATRAGLLEVEERLDTLRQRLEASEERVAVWRGSLADGGAMLDDGREVPALTEKYRTELGFWVELCVGGDPTGILAGDYEGTFGRWQRERLAELSAMLGLGDEAALAAWCAAQRVVEIGAGPYPMIAVAEWASAVACDPLADGYVAEGLLPKQGHMDRVVYVGAPGERVPMPAAAADLVVIENCLDHVSDPLRVMREIRRLLRPGGHCWLLCDLMDTPDAMHPNVFDEDRLRKLIIASGLDIVRDRVSDHRSHPEAYGELRALIQKPAAQSRAGALAETPARTHATHV